MTIEDQIRDALRDDAGATTPPPEGWDDVRARAEAHTRRRRAIRYPVAGLVAAAAIAAIVVGVAALRSTSESEAPSIATPPSAGMPEEIAAIVNDRLVVLDSETGAEIRTLAEDADGPVSVDDTYVYFGRRGDPACDGPTNEISRVPVEGGPAQVIARGLSPQISPDGRLLAYAGFPPNVFPECTTPSLLIVRDLTSGDELQYFTPDDGNDSRFPSPIGWAPDSRSLLYAANLGTEGVDARFGLKYFLLRGQAESGVLNERTPVELPAGTLYAFGAVSGDSLLVSRSTTGSRRPSPDDKYELAFVDATSGEVTRSVVAIGKDSVYDASLDLSGRHVVYTHSSTLPRVQRITVGDDDAVTLQAESIYAAWLPGRSPTPSTTTPATAPETTPEPPPTAPAATFPETIVGVDADGRLIVMASDDSTRRSELLAPPTDGSRYEAVSVGPGNAIAVARVTPSDSYCATFETGEIQLVNRETSRVETVGQGRHPALSPDGKRLAWVGVADCVTVLRVRDLATGAESVLTAPPSTDGSPDPQLSGPIAWAPDSRHLMVPMNIEPTREWWYVDADAPDGTLDGPYFRSGGEQGGPEVLAVRSARLVAAIEADPTKSNQVRLVEYDREVPAEVRSVDLFDIPPGGATATALAFDQATESYLMVVLVDGEPTLYRLAPDGDLVSLGTGISAADW